MGYFHYSLTIKIAPYKANNHFLFEIKRWSCLMNFFSTNYIKTWVKWKKSRDEWQIWHL